MKTLTIDRPEGEIEKPPHGDCDCQECERYYAACDEERIENELEAAESAYRSAVAELRGRYRAMLTVGQVPIPGMREVFLQQEQTIDALWSEYQRALKEARGE